MDIGPADLGLPGLDIDTAQFNTRLVLTGQLTQVIQDDAGSVPLIALKDTVVRVSPIVRRGLLGKDDISGRRFTGELRLVRGDRIVYSASPSMPRGVRVGPADALDEAAWDRELTVPNPSLGGEPIVVNCPLNFSIPAYYCRAGLTRVVVLLWESGQSADHGHLTWRGDALFFDVRAPRILAVPVDWTDPAGKVFSPSDKDMLSSVAGSTCRLPFPYFRTVISALRLSSNLMFGVAATGGGCNAAFTDLDTKVGLLQIFAALVGAGDVVGFVPTAALPKSGSYNAGCGITAIGTFVNDPETLAHEIGHHYRCDHVAPAPGATDPNYPKYPGPTGTIGSIGIDTSTSPPTLYSPSDTFDLMSYAGQRWTSPYTYRKIFDDRGRHQSEPADPRVVRRLVLVTRIRLLRDGTVVPSDFVRLETSLTALPELDGPSPLSVDVLDEQRQILSTQHLRHLVPQGCGCGCGQDADVPVDRLPWRDLTGIVEVPDGPVSLSFHAGGEPLLVVESGEAPTVTLAGPRRRDGVVRLGITADHPRATPSVVVYFSGDDGASWTPVAHDPGDVVELAEAQLPSRGTGRFRVVATAELLASTVDSDPIALPPAAIRAHLVLPDPACGAATNLSVLLDLRGHDAPSVSDVVWRSDADGELGRGFSVAVTLTPGRHEIVVALPDGLGGVLQERGIIVVGG